MMPLSWYGLDGVPGEVMSLPLVKVYQAPTSKPELKRRFFYRVDRSEMSSKRRARAVRVTSCARR